MPPSFPGNTICDRLFCFDFLKGFFFDENLEKFVLFLFENKGCKWWNVTTYLNMDWVAQQEFIPDNAWFEGSFLFLFGRFDFETIRNNKTKK